MYESLGITQEQMFSEVYSAWLRDTQEKRGEDSLLLFRGVVEDGFRERQIILPRQRLGVNTMTSLSALLYRSTLSKLDLYGNTLRDAGVEVLATLLRDLPQLSYLNIGANGITGISGVQALSNAIALHRKLSTFMIGSNRNDPYANRIPPSGMCALLEGCLRCRTLRVLDLTGCTLDGDSVRALQEDGGEMEDSKANATNNNNNTINSSNNNFNATGGGDDNATNFNGTGTMNHNNNNNNAALFGGEGSAALRPVGLLVALLQTSTTIASLCLKDTSLTVQGALQLIEALYGNITLAELDLGYNNLTERVGEAVGALLQSRVALQHNCALKKLSLSGNNIFGGGKEVGGNRVEAARSLRRQYVNPENLTAVLAATNSSNTWSETLGALQKIDARELPSGSLLSVLANDRILTHLELDACGLNGPCLALCCRSLSVNLGLKVLSLRHNLMNAEDSCLLGAALCRHSGLKRLYLSGNWLEDEGGCAFAKLLELNASDGLEVLDLRRTWLGDRSLVALGVALQLNTSLRALLLDDNHFSYKGCEAFAAFIEVNQTLLTCPLGSTSAPYPVQLRITRAMERNNKRLDSEESDELKRNLVRLHYQSYKLEEAKAELELLREKATDVKRTIENTDTQLKQDHSDFSKKIVELQEQIQNYTSQEESYKKQTEELAKELARQQAQYEEDMQLVQERLEAEVAMREKMEAQLKEAEESLQYWKEKGPAREAEMRETIEKAKKDTEDWAQQRRQYKADSEALEAEVKQLEEQWEQHKAQTAERKKSMASGASMASASKKKKTKK